MPTLPSIWYLTDFQASNTVFLQFFTFTCQIHVLEKKQQSKQPPERNGSVFPNDNPVPAVVHDLPPLTARELYLMMFGQIANSFKISLLFAQRLQNCSSMVQTCLLVEKKNWNWFSEKDHEILPALSAVLKKVFKIPSYSPELHLTRSHLTAAEAHAVGFPQILYFPSFCN